MKKDGKKTSNDINLGDLKGQLTTATRKVVTYRVFIFFLIVASVYGFILWRINVLSSAPASQAETAAKVAAQPHIDPATVEKIQSLQDNSVSVQSLFDQARDNPFQE